MFIRTLLAFLFCLSGTWVWAADPAIPPAGGKVDAPTTGSKVEAFAKIDKEWTGLIASLGALKTEYATATDAAKKAEIHKQYDEGIEKAKAMEGKLVETAEAAYAEAPNANPKITEILVAVLGERVARDDYEAAFKLGKLLMENKCSSKYIATLAGVSAYCVNEYDLASLGCRRPKPRESVPESSSTISTRWTNQGRLGQRRRRFAKPKPRPTICHRMLMKTSRGDIEIELFENEAPNSVLNFITLVDKGFYNGLKFHRVLPGFMAQGGDPKGDGDRRAGLYDSLRMLPARSPTALPRHPEHGPRWSRHRRVTVLPHLRADKAPRREAYGIWPCDQRI